MKDSNASRPRVGVRRPSVGAGLNDRPWEELPEYLLEEALRVELLKDSATLRRTAGQFFGARAHRPQGVLPSRFDARPRSGADQGTLGAVRSAMRGRVSFMEAKTAAELAAEEGGDL